MCDWQAKKRVWISIRWPHSTLQKGMLSVIFSFFFSFFFGLLFIPCQLLSRTSYSLVCQTHHLSTDGWLHSFISIFFFSCCLFLVCAHVYVPGHGMSHHFLNREQVTGLIVFLFSVSRFFSKFLIPLTFPLSSLFFSPSLSVFPLSVSVSSSFAQMYRAALLWENKHHCLSVAPSQTGPHKHWSLLG